MALDKSSLENAIKDAMLQNLEQADADEASKNAAVTAVEQLANALASAIDAFVKSGTVEFQPGSVEGTCPVGGGPLTLGSASGGTIA